MDKQYFEIKSDSSVFQVWEGCCFIQVIYEGSVDVLHRLDDGYGNGLTSSDLVCMCHPSKKINKVSRDYYELKLDAVNRARMGL